MTDLPAMAGRSVTVKVPATTANLGPGLDTLGLALAIYDELEVRVRPEPGVFVEVHGVGEGEVPTDETNLVAHSIRYVFDAYQLPMPGLTLVAHNVIPHGRGLGSSGAAIVSGIMAAKGLLEGIVEIDSDSLLRLATELEGHPDNVAPGLFGGLTIAWTGSDGPRHKIAHGAPRSFAARRRARVDHVDQARSQSAARVCSARRRDFNVSRSALLVAALIQSPELLLDATEDKLHQNYRASAMKETDDLIRVLRAAGLPAVVSGAGPSVLVLASDPAQRLVAAELVERSTATPWLALMPAVDFKGATVTVHPVEALA